MVWWVVARAS